MRLLVVCTANRCRSPMAEALLRHLIAARAGAVTVTSAGVLPGGEPIAPEARAVIAGYGLDMDSHRSRQLTGAMIADADLVIGMARAHIREVVTLDPQAWPRAFTLLELVRRGEERGARHPDHPLYEWLRVLHDGRRRFDMLGGSAEDDIADPMGGSQADFQRTADQLRSLCRRAVDLLGV